MPTDPASSDDIERLASCLGLLVADGGEAENAARAVRTIARRVGLTGGQLKQMFIAGATGPLRPAPDATADEDREAMRRELSVAEIARVAARREVAFLDKENASLRLTAGETAVTVRRWRIASFVAAFLFVGLFVATALRTPTAVSLAPVDHAGQDATPFGRAAIVRSGGATLFDAPDSASANKTPLVAGTHLIVRRLLWRTLQQWAEVEIGVGGRTGYVVTTGIDLS